MIRFALEKAANRSLQILCLGCHSDDIEIGCGGSVLRLAQEHPDASFHWVVFSASGIRSEEARCGAELFAGRNRLHTLLLKDFQDGFLPFAGAEVKTVFEELKEKLSPDLILTHNRSDAHQDHRLVADLTWNTFRNHLILEYEIPKYDGDMGRPSVFVPLAADVYRRKVCQIMSTFKSQGTKRWFREETFLSLMRLRGMECNAPSGYAEAFYCSKVVF
jgi:LmbE family N-acetylglucosaminyl deacetylase